LLRSRGIEFSIVPSDIPETPEADEAPATFVQRMARDKALSVATALDAPAWVLGADTVVVVDDEILGKPRDADNAHRMLRRLSGRVHQVMTGVALIAPNRTVASLFHVVTDVEMHVLAQDQIETYVASGEPMDKAGAYAIQAGAAPFIAGVSGSYSNVVGLPLEEVCALLDRHMLGRASVGSRA
jgi:septum formation protein